MQPTKEEIDEMSTKAQKRVIKFVNELVEEGFSGGEVLALAVGFFQMTLVATGNKQLALETLRFTNEQAVKVIEEHCK